MTRLLLTVREPGRDPVPLVVDGDRFTGPDDGGIDLELETAGLFALPGLADSHAHLGYHAVGEMLTLSDDQVRRNARDNAWMQLQGGVLLVVDKGSGSDATLEVLALPPTERPEASMAGRIIAPSGGYYPGYGWEVGEEGLVEAVRATDGRAAWVKIIGDWPRPGRGPLANYTEAALATAVRVAHAAGRRVAVHTMAPAGVRGAVDAGVDSVEHGAFLEAEDLLTLAGRSGSWVPTVLNVEFLHRFLGADSSGGRLMARALDNLRQLLPEAERIGLTVLAGTDLAVPHGAIAEEALKLREYGMTAPGALIAASTAAYEYLGIDRALGPGSPANAVFFADDPREHLETLRRPVIVLRAGRVVSNRLED